MSSLTYWWKVRLMEAHSVGELEVLGKKLIKFCNTNVKIDLCYLNSIYQCQLASLETLC